VERERRARGLARVVRRARRDGIASRSQRRAVARRAFDAARRIISKCGRPRGCARGRARAERRRDAHLSTKHEPGLVAHGVALELLVRQRVRELEVERAVHGLHDDVQARRGDVREREDTSVVGQVALERAVLAPAAAIPAAALKTSRHLAERRRHLALRRHLGRSGPATGVPAHERHPRLRAGADAIPTREDVPTPTARARPEDSSAARAERVRLLRARSAADGVSICVAPPQASPGADAV